MVVQEAGRAALGHERVTPYGSGQRLTLVTDGAAEARAAAGRTSARGLLRFPLFYKILIANAVILGLVIGACSVVAHGAAQTTNYALLLGAGLVLSILSNALIIRLALSPLARLERTARRVQAGDLTARVEPSPLADRELERIATTFNTMLDSGEAYRRRLREVAARALSAQEEERKRIARELHDGTAQTLAALRVRMRVARAAGDGAERDAQLDRLSADLDEATEEVRRIAQGLRPPALDMLGLAPAIESYARALSSGGELQVETDIRSLEGLLTPEAELALCRIVQEALSNAARHSGARRAWVRIGLEGGSVVALIRDDGRGFAVETAMAATGLGLFGMQERGAYVGGAVEIESAPGRGTRVRVTIPVVETARYA